VLLRKPTNSYLSSGNTQQLIVLKVLTQVAKLYEIIASIKREKVIKLPN